MQQLPKLSQFTALLRQPEAQVEGIAKQQGVTLPLGPVGVLLEIQTAIEAGRAPSPEAIMRRVMVVPPTRLPIPGAAGGGEFKSEPEKMGEVRPSAPPTAVTFKEA